MATYVQLVDSEGAALHIEEAGAESHLVVENHARIQTVFKVAGTTAAATTIVAAPRKGFAISITDLIVNQDKVAAGSIIIQFTDGTNTEIIVQAKTKDATFSMAHGFVGKMDGWKDARVEMISAGTNPNTNVTVIFQNLQGAGVLSFADWDARRN